MAAAAVENLPEELMTLILAKLPVKSLLRFKCVRKSWYSLIKSPEFIRLHRSSSSSSPQFIFSRCIDRQQHVLPFHSFETLDNLGNDIIIPFSDCSPVSSRPCDVNLSGHCNGLVCITSFDDDLDYLQILICNPAIREFRSLSVPPSGYEFGFHMDSVAFGSDPSTGQYKVVMIGLHFGTIDSLERRVKVYDFRTDSWRETGVVIPSPFCYSVLAVSLNGAFHWSPVPWPFFEGEKNDDSILTFNMRDEVTGSIPLPDNVYYHRKEVYVSSKSQLSLIVYDLAGRFDIFVMTEYGVKESWTWLFQIGPLPSDIYYPLAFWDQQRILLQTKEGQFVTYDLEHQQHRHLPIYGSMDVHLYFESLVSVNGIGGD